MAKNTLPTNYQDDIMNSAMGGSRRYKMINNSDGTVSFQDVTTYDQVGSNFGAGQLNAITQAVNASADASKIIDDADDCSAVTENGYISGAKALGQVNRNLGGLRFGIDGDGNYGYYGADGSLIPFKSGGIDLSNLTEKVICEYSEYAGPATGEPYDVDFTNLVYLEFRVDAWTNSNTVFIPYGYIYLDSDTSKYWGFGGPKAGVGYGTLLNTQELTGTHTINFVNPSGSTQHIGYIKAYYK